MPFSLGLPFIALTCPRAQGDSAETNGFQDAEHIHLRPLAWPYHGKIVLLPTLSRGHCHRVRPTCHSPRPVVSTDPILMLP